MQTIFQKEISFRVVVNIGESEELLDLEIESVEPYGDKRIALFDSNQIDRQKEVIEEEFEPEY